MPAKPAILAVDDDPPVLRAVERDLRARYADDYRVIGAGSAADALEVVRELTQRDEPVALFLVDQRMPTMTGTEFLVEALPLQPDAKRVLLTAYADTDVAIRAINEIKLDQYLLKPWDPPEEKLYPVVDDLLADWVAGYRPAFEGLRLLSGRWAPRGHEIRDFLTRNQVPYTWLDPDTDEDGRRLAASLDEPVDATRPVIVLPDGRSLRDPGNRDLADAIGMSTHAALPFYDLVIVGGGPAGLAAAVYGASEGLKTLMVEREAPGGQAGTTSRIENYLGFPSGLSGSDLARRALTQAKRLGAEILSSQEATTIRREDPYRFVGLDDGTEVSCQAVIVTTGVSYRQLEVPGAAELAGAGVYYGAATTEAKLYQDAEVAVVGSGNSAGQAVVHLARFARAVHLVIRGDDVSERDERLPRRADSGARERPDPHEHRGRGGARGDPSRGRDLLDAGRRHGAQPRCDLHLHRSAAANGLARWRRRPRRPRLRPDRAERARWVGLEPRSRAVPARVEPPRAVRRRRRAPRLGEADRQRGR